MSAQLRIVIRSFLFLFLLLIPLKTLPKYSHATVPDIDHKLAEGANCNTPKTSDKAIEIIHNALDQHIKKVTEHSKSTDYMQKALKYYEIHEPKITRCMNKASNYEQERLLWLIAQTHYDYVKTYSGVHGKNNKRFHFKRAIKIGHEYIDFFLKLEGKKLKDLKDEILLLTHAESTFDKRIRSRLIFLGDAYIACKENEANNKMSQNQCEDFNVLLDYYQEKHSERPEYFDWQETKNKWQEILDKYCPNLNTSEESGKCKDYRDYYKKKVENSSN